MRCDIVRTDTHLAERTRISVTARVINLYTTDFNEDPHSNIKLRPDCLIRTDIIHPDQTLIFEVEEEEEDIDGDAEDKDDDGDDRDLNEEG